MKALAIVGTTIVASGIGGLIGTWIGDRRSHYMDFGIPTLLSGLIGLLLGGLIGIIVGSAAFA